MRFNGVILERLSLVKIYLGKDSGQVIQYKFTLSLYLNINVQIKVFALLVDVFCIFDVQPILYHTLGPIIRFI